MSRHSRSQRRPRPFLEILEDRQLLSAYIVNSTLDDEGYGTLRAGIEAVNAGKNNGILIELGSGATIALNSALPALTASGGFVSESANSLDTQLTVANNVSVNNGLYVDGSNDTISGFVINGFNANGIVVAGSNDRIVSNTISGNGDDGIAVTGTDNTIGGTVSVAGNVLYGNAVNGIEILDSGTVVQGNNAGVSFFSGATNYDGIVVEANNNTIGGTSAAAANFLTGNANVGLVIDSGVSGVVVQGNYIGTDAGGVDEYVGNASDGIDVFGSHNTIGGTATGAGNKIYYNSTDGVYVDASGVMVQGNSISNNSVNGVVIAVSNNTVGGSTAAARNVFFNNTNDGVLIEGAASGVAVQGNYVGMLSGTIYSLSNGNGIEVAGSGNTIGGTTAGTRNVISGNVNDGVLIDSGVTSIVLQGNFIGTDFTGQSGSSGNRDGIEVAASNLTVGGTNSGARNVISGNTNDGIVIDSGVTGTQVQGNFIGTDLTGANAIGNSYGIAVVGSNTTIGGTAAAARNVISGNTADGVDIAGLASGVVVQGNFIGTDSSGKKAVGNSIGVEIAVPNFTLGGTVAGARNFIDGNNTGVLIDDVATGVAVQGNYVGVDVTGKTALGNTVGIEVNGNDSTIGGTTSAARNLISGNSVYGVVLDAAASGIRVQGNYVGTDYTGTVALANNEGILVAGSDNTIGGLTAGSRNVISANQFNGVTVEATASGVIVQGNYVGTDVSGNVNLGNGYYGVEIAGSDNTVGGTAATARNVIAGSPAYGVWIDTGASGNALQGNFIGTNVSGTSVLGNTYGVGVAGSDNTIGGSVSGARNVISGSRIWGIHIASGADANLVQGNYVGTNNAGTGALANGVGVLVFGNDNTIGGTTAAARNVISGNSGDGVAINNAVSGNQIQGNYVGTTYNGTSALGNFNGVEIYSSDNTVGGTVSGARNLISGNSNDGVLINSAASGVEVQGNFIGVNAVSKGALANSANGVEVIGNDNTVGGTIASARNVISGNGLSGVSIDANVTGVALQGNFIGLDSSGKSAIGNGGNSGSGVIVGSNGNTIGGTTTGARNVISGNYYGITLASGSLVQGNYVGTDVTGHSAVGNLENGISVGGSSNTIGGLTVGARNLISGNAVDGINLGNTSGNLVQGNFIGTNVSGNAALANGTNGIESYDSSDTIGGTTSGARNVISGNTDDGIVFNGGSGNLAQGNYVGTDATGVVAVANGQNGIRDRSGGNTIGGTSAGAGNLLSGNTEAGLEIATNGDVVQGNFIGTDHSGAIALHNSVGIQVDGNNNTLGGTVAGSRNLISGNANDGVLLGSSYSGSLVQGNFIGVNLAGSSALANARNGVEDQGTADSIGGTTSAARNVISGNGNDGILFLSTAGSDQALGNFVGTDSSGTKSLGNSGYGVEVEGANETIGGTVAGARNLISGNSNDGIFLGTSAGGGLVQGNYVGTDTTGSKPLANANNGVEIDASNCTLGGTTLAARNLISGNLGSGVLLDGFATGDAVQGNFIGTDHTGAAALSNGAYGVNVFGSNNSIGGSIGAASNTIAFNKTGGVNVNIGNGDTIRWNSIFSNGSSQTGPGIMESGANNNIVAPTLTGAALVGTTLTVKGTFAAPTGGVAYVLEFFANPSGDAEGKVFLGRLTLKSTSAGTVSFTYTTTTSVIGSDPLVTSALTDSTGDTSAFSAGVTV